MLEVTIGTESALMLNSLGYNFRYGGGFLCLQAASEFPLSLSRKVLSNNLHHLKSEKNTQVLGIKVHGVKSDLNTDVKQFKILDMYDY